MQYVIGVDLGGTQLRAALVDQSGQIVAHERVRTLVHEGPPAVISRIIALIERVRGALPSDGELLGVGIGAPGPLNPETGLVFAPTNMPGWLNIQLRDPIAEQCGLPVIIDNDANVAALGEWYFGGGKGTRHLVYLTVSTGIGGGVIIDRRLLRGRKGAAAELGFMLVDLEQGRIFEELASGTALGEAAAAAMRSNAQSILHTLATPDSVTAAHVSQAAAQGDPLALQLMDREAQLLGMGFASILHIFSPELMLVGGSVVLENPQLLDAARAYAYEKVLVDLYREVPIELARLGDQAGVLGAAALILVADKDR